jgi:anthranilate 1,2-dioxygenase small subunit
MIADRPALYDLYAAYGALIDAGDWDAWLDLFAAICRYQIIPRENADLGLPAGLIFCDSRAVLEDRIMALREANKYNIHWDRHVIGLPRVLRDAGAEISDRDYRVHDVPLRGFWSYYAELLGIEPDGAVR